jgi:hypothetical protein
LRCYKNASRYASLRFVRLSSAVRVRLYTQPLGETSSRRRGSGRGCIEHTSKRAPGRADRKQRRWTARQLATSRRRAALDPARPLQSAQRPPRIGTRRPSTLQSYDGLPTSRSNSASRSAVKMACAGDGLSGTWPGVSLTILPSLGKVGASASGSSARIASSSSAAVRRVLFADRQSCNSSHLILACKCNRRIEANIAHQAPRAACRALRRQYSPRARSSNAKSLPH